jgi:hypothetical protein
MATVVQLVVVLALAINSIAKLIARATTIVNAIEANKATFATPTPPLAQVTAAIAALTNAEAAFKGHLGTRADRDNAKAALVLLMQQLHVYVQGVVTANPGQAEVIAQDAAMTLRKLGAHNKPALAVKQTVSQAVDVAAKALKGAGAYEWQYSLDGGKTWLAAPPSTGAKTTITGLPSGTMVSFRQRAVTKAGPGDWSQPISALVS